MPTNKTTKRKLSEDKRKAVDALIRRHAGRNAVVCLLKSNHSFAYTKYEIYGLSDGTALYVNIDRMRAHLMRPSSVIAKRFAKRHAQDAAQQRN